jgi:hypothetical protein
MPPRAKSTKKSVAGKRYPLNMRTTFELRRKLEDAAKASGISLTQETERRLERSFREDEVLGGGPEVRELTHTMTAIFAFVAKRTAIAAGHPEWTAKEWLTDQDCYQAATVEVCRTLIERLPNPSRQQMDDTLQMLIRRLAIGLTHKGEIEGVSGFIEPKDQPQ